MCIAGRRETLPIQSLFYLSSAAVLMKKKTTYPPVPVPKFFLPSFPLSRLLSRPNDELCNQLECVA